MSVTRRQRTLDALRSTEGVILAARPATTKEREHFSVGSAVKPGGETSDDNVVDMLVSGDDGDDIRPRKVLEISGSQEIGLNSIQVSGRRQREEKSKKDLPTIQQGEKKNIRDMMALELRCIVRESFASGYSEISRIENNLGK
mmetsp:Transcript_32771/g.75428  ORF Transcript_32771/g.75428 Transcript_32771/m.75428 type:complete len:143 (-) Transcript_32771:323-751(-)